MTASWMTSFDVRVALSTDWHVGVGQGLVGVVDATVRRDRDGLPFVPAKTLTGVWRDACEQVAGWLCGPPEQAGPWWAWVDWLFGSQPAVTGDRVWATRGAPIPAALHVSPAYFPAAVSAAVGRRPALAAAAVVLRPGVAMDDETGVARDSTLRVEERARPAVLHARVQIGADGGGGDVPQAAELLLRAGAAAVDSLGGRRNRGAGRCRLLLPSVDTHDTPGPDPGEINVLMVPGANRPVDARLAELLSDKGLVDSPGTPPALRRGGVLLDLDGAAAAAGPIPGEQSGAEPVVRRIVFEVVTTLVAQHRVLGNVVQTRDMVPGTLLLPAVLPRLSRRVGHREVVVTDARPAVAGEDGVSLPAWPAPMVWYRPKQRHHSDVVNAAERRPDPGERRKAMRSGHVAWDGPGVWRSVSPQTAVSTHAVVDDDAGRPTAEGGNVFSYLGLAPGTLLWCDVVTPHDVDLTLVEGEELRLGRSRKDDFGRVVVRSIEVLPPPGAAPEALSAGARVRVWCVSDVLVRDAWGAVDATATGVAEALAQAWQVPVEAVGLSTDGPVAAAYRAARRDSFHTRWGRPRPSLVGLAAGSVVTVRLGGSVTGEVAARTVRDGIGERTAEGFGRVRLDTPEVLAAAPRLVTRRPDDPPDTTHPPEGAHLDGLPAEGPSTLERAAVRAESARRVSDLIAADPGRAIAGWASVSSRAQWGSLLEQLPRLRSETGRVRVTRWLDQTAAVRRRSQSWGDPALAAVKMLLTDPEQVWTVLRMDGAAFSALVFDDSRIDATRAAMWSDAVTALVTAVCRHATRQLQAGDATAVGR